MTPIRGAASVALALFLISSAGLASGWGPSLSPSHPGGHVEPAEVLPPAEVRAMLEERILEAAERSAPLPGPRPVLRGLAPIVNLNSGATYSDLALAVAGADAGDTLRVQQDLAVGQTVIDRDLTIEGRTGAETVSATEDTGSAGDDRGWFLVESGVDLHVRDLVFDGSGFLVHQGFRHRGSGSFERVEFREIRYQESGPAYQGVAVAAFGDRVDVLDSRFEGIGRVGVLYFGAGVAGSLFAGNTYLGKGDGDFLDYGLDVGSGAGVAVWNNVFRDCRGITSERGVFGSAGLLGSTFSAPGTQVLSVSNQFLDNGFGVALGFDGSDTTTAVLEFDRFAGSTFNGLETESSVPVVAERVWWGCNLGPGAAGCDAIGGVAAGSVDADPWLVLEATAAETVLCAGESVAVRGTLTSDSDGGDVSGLGSVDDGIVVSFAADLGSLSAPTAETSAGVAGVEYLGSEAGSATVDVALDGEAVSIGILVEAALFCDGFESGDVSAWI